MKLDKARAPSFISALEFESKQVRKVAREVRRVEKNTKTKAPRKNSMVVSTRSFNDDTVDGFVARLQFDF